VLADEPDRPTPVRKWSASTRERILGLSGLKADASRLLDQIRDEPPRSSSSISSPQTPLKGAVAHLERAVAIRPDFTEGTLAWRCCC
jgi:hypothetical protein